MVRHVNTALLYVYPRKIIIVDFDCDRHQKRSKMVKWLMLQFNYVKPDIYNQGEMFYVNSSTKFNPVRANPSWFNSMTGPKSDSRADNPRNAFHKHLGETNFPVFAFEHVVL